MKIAFGSDIHLEFGDLDIADMPDADVLVLAGDIIVGQYLEEYQRTWDYGYIKSELYHNFFQKCSIKYTNIVYIMGNHEYYHGFFNETFEKIKANLAYIPKLHIFKKGSVEIDGVKFICATLWTDVNGDDPETHYALKYSMNDYRIILCEDNRIFSTYRSYAEHQHALDFIEEEYENLKDGQKCVVVTHHAPSPNSIHPRYRNDYLMNGGYSSNLNMFIEDRDRIQLWIHGHVHNPQDYIIGKTNVICNPRGYCGIEPMAEDFKFKLMEI